MRRVADEWDLVVRELAVVREENARLKAALRNWQSAVGAAMTSPQARMAGNRIRGGWPEPVPKPLVVDGDEYPSGYVVHVPVVAADFGAALEIGRLVVAALRHLPAVQVGGAAVSPEGRLDRHRAVCCNRRLADDARCLLPPGHAPVCAAEP